jgi:hypothetical protein
MGAQRVKPPPPILRYESRGTQRTVGHRQAASDSRNADGKGFLRILWPARRGVTLRGNGDQEKEKRSLINLKTGEP